MIHLVKSALETIALAEQNPSGDLRGFRTIRKGDWKEIPIEEQPALCFEWGGGMTFDGQVNPLDLSFDIQAVIKMSNPNDPDVSTEELERLLWDLDETSDWGLIPFLLSNRGIQLSPTPYTVLFTFVVGEPIVERIETNFHSYSTIVLINARIQRDARHGTHN